MFRKHVQGLTGKLSLNKNFLCVRERESAWAHVIGITWHGTLTCSCLYVCAIPSNQFVNNNYVAFEREHSTHKYTRNKKCHTFVIGFSFNQIYLLVELSTTTDSIELFWYSVEQKGLLTTMWRIKNASTISIRICGLSCYYSEKYYVFIVIYRKFGIRFHMYKVYQFK